MGMDEVGSSSDSGLTCHSILRCESRKHDLCGGKRIQLRQPVLEWCDVHDLELSESAPVLPSLLWSVIEFVCLIIVSLIPFIPLFHHPIWAFKLPGEHTHESSAGTHDAAVSATTLVV